MSQILYKCVEKTRKPNKTAAVNLTAIDLLYRPTYH